MRLPKEVSKRVRRAQKRNRLPLVARASSPSYLNRLVVLLYPDGGQDFFEGPDEARRDKLIDMLVSRGLAERVHVHCPDPGCACTFPTMQVTDGFLAGLTRETSQLLP